MKYKRNYKTPLVIIKFQLNGNKSFKHYNMEFLDEAHRKKKGTWHKQKHLSMSCKKNLINDHHEITHIHRSSLIRIY